MGVRPPILLLGGSRETEEQTVTKRRMGESQIRLSQTAKTKPAEARMSRWTKGELTIGEIAQMERALIDVKLELAQLPVKVGNTASPLTDAVMAIAKTQVGALTALSHLAQIIDLMLKG